MPDTDSVFAGSIPDVYDDYLVPLIFEDFAADLAARVAGGHPATVLETAAGSGVVARALAPLLPPASRYVVTDLNQPMLDRAARRQPGGGAPIDWRQADALALPFEDDSFDTVCCQFGVMFFPDRVAGYREAHRTLRDGGRLVFNTWDRIEENHFAECVTDAAAELCPEDPPRFLARTPHGYHDTARIAAELAEAGFDRIEIDTLTRDSRADSPRIPAIAYCQGTPLRTEIEARGDGALERVTEHAARAIAARFGPGPISGRIRGHVVTATK